MSSAVFVFLFIAVVLAHRDNESYYFLCDTLPQLCDK